MTSAKSSENQKSYHHGDLQRVIVETALEVLSESQSSDFSVREVARRAGVSHNAPFRHFADKNEMLAAVSAAGFSRLAEKMHAATADIADARQRLEAIAQTYVESALENPALYRLMFEGFLTGPDFCRPAIEKAEADKIREQVVVTISDGALGHAIPRTAENQLTIDAALLIFWTQMHGLSLLLVNRLIGPPEKAPELAAMALRSIIDGLANISPAAPADLRVGPSSVC